MTYSLEILRAADKFLERLSRQQPRDAEAIEDAVDDLAEQPRPHGCKALKGYPGVWRIRIGNYRVCYEVDDAKLRVLVITISTRDDVYDLLRRYVAR